MKLDYKLVHDDENHNIDINYSSDLIQSKIQIIPNELLKEKTIKLQENTQILLLKEIKCNEKMVLNFDLFSAIFYHLSRYEEYISENRDEHDRFIFSESILYKNNLLNYPLVDAWILQFSQLISQHCNFDIKLPSSTIKPSIDVDSVFAYKGRGFVRQCMGFAKSLVQLNTYEFINRFKVLMNLKEDPNDNFEYQFDVMDHEKIIANYFIQVGEYGKWDKNIVIQNLDFVKIIQNIKASGHIVGLHPSYQSFLQKQTLNNEWQTLKNVVNQELYHSRQHFLRFKLPDTFQDLIHQGIRYEYSMGYSEINGFRAGTGSSFYWFNLSKNETTELLLQPFVWMDVACKQFLKMNHKEAIEEVLRFKKICFENNSDFCFVYHNESLSEHRGWENWRNVFEICLKSNI